MSPTPKELGIVAGNRVRVLPEFLPQGHNEREVFFVAQAPAPGRMGEMVLKGQLTGHTLRISTRQDALKEKIQD